MCMMSAKDDTVTLFFVDIVPFTEREYDHEKTEQRDARA